MARKRKEPSAPPQEPVAPPVLRLEWRSPAELSANPRNWRKHPEAQQAALAGVLSEVGWAGACLYNETTGLLIDGHLRQKVALANGADKIPVLVGNWTPEQEAKILATLDPLAGMAEADPVALDALLREVNTGCEELQQMLDDLWQQTQDDAIADAPTAPIDEDDPPEPQAAVVTRAGDMWTLGPHRLLCGDCREPAAWERLLCGERVDLLLTDPPYGQAFLSNHYGPNQSSPNPMGRIENDDKPRPEMLEIAIANLGEESAAYVCTRWAQCEAWRSWLSERMQVRNVIVWKKNNWSAGDLHGAFGFMYEQLIFAANEGHKLRGSREPDVWEFDRVAPTLHPTMKPVGLMAKCMEKSSDAGDICCDPFMGSGTSLIAAAQLGRVSRGIEISPQYCDVIIRRFIAKYPYQPVTRHDGVTWQDAESGGANPTRTL